MELLPYYFLTSALLLTIFLSFLKAKALSSKASARCRLPTPWQLPIIGSMHHLIAGGPLPYRALRDLSKKYSSLMLLKLGEAPTVVVSSIEGAKEVMKTQDVSFATRPISVTVNTLSWGGRDIIFAPYGDYWRQTRKVCTVKLNGPKRVQAYRSIREEEMKNLIHNITTAAESSPLVNLSELMTAYISDITAIAITGATHKEHPEFLRAWGNSLKLSTGSNMAHLFPSKKWLTDILSDASREAKRCNDIIDGLFENMIKMKIARNAISDTADKEDEDLLDRFLKMHAGEGVTPPLELDTIKGVFLNFFGAGGEISADTLDWAMSELLRDPLAMEKAQKEVRSVLKRKPTITDDDVKKLPYIKNIIKETLRLHVPIPLLPRLALADCRVLGYDIPKGTKVLVNAWALGRDPKYWNDGDAFKPERYEEHAVDYRGTELKYIPFGAGRRQCPGTAFGIANVGLCLANLLYHFDWELPHGMKPHELDMTELFGVTIRRKSHLFLRPILRIPFPTV